MKKNLFIIGNGESRKYHELDHLNLYGKIYGCNALYRDFTPDGLYLVIGKCNMRFTHQVIVLRTNVILKVGKDYLVIFMI